MKSASSSFAGCRSKSSLNLNSKRPIYEYMHPRSSLRLLALLLTIVPAVAQTDLAASTGGTPQSIFVDPLDGAFDAGQFILSAAFSLAYHHHRTRGRLWRDSLAVAFSLP